MLVFLRKRLIIAIVEICIGKYITEVLALGHTWKVAITGTVRRLPVTTVQVDNHIERTVITIQADSDINQTVTVVWFHGHIEQTVIVVWFHGHIKQTVIVVWFYGHIKQTVVIVRFDSHLEQFLMLGHSAGVTQVIVELISFPHISILGQAGPFVRRLSNL